MWRYAAILPRCAGLFLLSTVVSASVEVQPACRFPVTCRCGKSSEQVTICSEDPAVENFCSPWANCKKCRDGLAECLECPEGFEGPSCTKASERKIFSRPKRQAAAPRPQGKADEVNASSCDDPGFASNSHRRLVSDHSRSNVPRVFQNGESVFYSCKSGDYLLKGPPVRTCRNGKWSKSKPSCTRINVSEKETKFCRNPGPILDGTVSVILPDFSVGSDGEDVLEYPEGTRLLYYCEEYHALIGFSVLTCQATGSWSSDPPMCSSDCGRILDESKESMTVNTNRNFLSEEWPWTVAVAVANGSDSLCIGALLDSQTVISVAHCVQHADSFVLYFGKRYRSNNKDDSEVMVRRSTHLISHKDFNSRTMDFDIALIKFAPKIEFTNRIQPICLPSRESTARNIMTGRSGFATGWGTTEHQNRARIQGEELQMVQFTVLTNNACVESMKRQGYPKWAMTQNQFCAEETSGLALCIGNSGAPLVFYNYNADRYILEGLVSAGVAQCGMADMQTIFTRVLQFIPWILENMKL